ncbi:MAG: SPOR domain-containing protein [Gammaproteobacteria bacterium]
MARDYKRPPNAASNERPPGSWMSFLTGLGIGLVGAVLVYWWMQGGGDVRRSVPAAADVESPAPPSAADVPAPAPETAGEESSLPPPTPENGEFALPKFDFYKILPEIEVKVPDEELAAVAPEPASSAPPSDPATIAERPTYLLQIASFQDFNDADQAKAQLALQGVSATIQRVVINGQDVWHRVHVGPYSDLGDAQRMRTRLDQLGVNAIVLKLGSPGR